MHRHITITLCLLTFFLFWKCLLTALVTLMTNFLMKCKTLVLLIIDLQ